MADGLTTYSDKVPGERRNYHQPVRFDLTDGYLGITQSENGAVKDRVLLSPKQVKELLAFVSKRRSHQ